MSDLAIGLGVSALLGGVTALSSKPPSTSALSDANAEAEQRALAREDELKTQRDARTRAIGASTRGRRSLLNPETLELGVRPSSTV